MLTRRKAIKTAALATVSAAVDSCLPKLNAQPSFRVIRQSRPRLYHPADDPEYTFVLPKDPARKAILQNLIADCEELSSRQPWKSIPQNLDSPHPYHQLYITFYSGMQASALIEQYAFAWRMTHDDRWLARAKQWLLAAASWEHSDRIEEHFYTANRYHASEHGGTHIDAPIHFAPNGKTLDMLSLDQLTGAAVVVDVSAKALDDADYQITVADLKAWETKHGQIPKGSIVLLNTGFARHWPDAKKYLGTAEKGPDAVAKLHFPGLHPDAARWLVSERTIKAVGLDTASIDYGQSQLFESHRILFEKNVPAFENVAALDRLPATGAYVVALPMKIKGGSGGPLRIVAWVP